MRIFTKHGKEENKVKKRSKLWVLFHHPIRCILWWIALFYIEVIVSSFLLPGLFDSMFTLVLLLNVYFSLHIVQKKENKYVSVETQKIKRPSLLGTLISSSIQSSNRRSKAMQDGIQDAIMGSFSSKSEDAWQKARRQADADARARWDAIDRQKKRNGMQEMPLCVAKIKQHISTKIKRITGGNKVNAKSISFRG